MIKLFEHLFKKQPQFDYTIAEYFPEKSNRSRAGATEYEQDEAEELDEMEIDNIYKGM